MPTATQVGRLAEVVRSYESRKSNEGLEPPMTAALRAGCDAVIQESVLTPLSPSELERLQSAIVKSVTKRLESVPKEPGAARTEALALLLRTATSRSTARSFVEAWLGFETGLKPAPGSAVVGWPPQVSASDNPGELTFDPASTHVLAESGGASNGLVDSGEWVRLSLSFINSGTQSWHSTSATLQGVGECLYTDPRLEHVLTEASPGERATLTPWVYLAPTCSRTPQLRVQLADTHRSPTPYTVMLELHPTRVHVPVVVADHLDTDVPGSSDGMSTPTLLPGAAFEYSLDFDDDGAATNATESFAVAPPARPLFERLEARDVPALKDERGVSHAGDDLDAVLLTNPAYGDALKAAGAQSPWLSGSRPVAWVAIAVELEVSAPGAVKAVVSATPAMKKEKKGKEVKAARAAVAEAEPSASPSSPPPAPPPANVVALAKGFISIVPRPVPPVVPGAVEAAAGYEVLFDGEGFAAAYGRLLHPPEPAKPTAPPHAAYSFTFYKALPLTAAEGEPVRVAERPVEAPVERAVEEVPPAAPVAAPAKTEDWPKKWVRAEVGGGGSYVGLTAPATRTDFWGGATSLASGGVALGVQVGPSWNVGLSAAAWFGTAGPTGGRKTLTALQFALLGGWTFRPVRSLELTPAIGVGLQPLWVVLNSSGDVAVQDSTIDFVAEFTARWRFATFLGAFFKLGLHVGPGGAFVFNTDTVHGIAPHASAGLTLFL